MIPVIKKPEPTDFDKKVRQPGKRFLLTKPKPKSKEWKAYWTKSLDDLRKSYNCTCAYSATWIPHGTGSHSVDHFIPKDTDPNLAYEWSNFRYVSGRFNSRKRLQIIIDPFLIQLGWFQIDFTTMLIQPEVSLPQPTKDAITNAINILHLNKDDKLVEERIDYILKYRNKDISFEYLKERAPFIAFEMTRQRI